MEEAKDARLKEVVGEENIYGKLHSNEAEKGIEGELFESPIQAVLSEGYTPPITQHPSPKFKVVEIIKECTEKGIVTKEQKMISMKKRRSVRNNTTHTLTSKDNQTENTKKKLVRRNTNQRALISSSFPLE